MKKFIKLFSLVLLFILIFNTIFPYVSNASNAISELPESQLGLANILNIILISVGVVLILLGIAIFIRLKKG